MLVENGVETDFEDVVGAVVGGKLF